MRSISVSILSLTADLLHIKGKQKYDNIELRSYLYKVILVKGRRD
jgi:hypothetical protein